MHADHDDRLDEDEGDESGVLSSLLDMAKIWILPILLLLSVRSMFYEPFRIPSSSMLPTLQIGDMILVSKSAYGLRYPLTRIPVGTLEPPARGDVVVFELPQTGLEPAVFDLPIPFTERVDYVKRVVALPGETVSVSGGVLSINDVPQTRTPQGVASFEDDRCTAQSWQRLDEHLADVVHPVLAAPVSFHPLRDYGPVTVPPDHIFVMGDNRDNSADSRVFGMVPLRNVKGRATFVWLSFDACADNAVLFGRLRSDRVGVRVE